jgi:hypothetical protein
MGGRAGGGGGAGLGSKSRGGGQQPRSRIYKGTKEWKSVEQNANGLFWSAATDRNEVKGDHWSNGKYQTGMTQKEAEKHWNGAYNNITKALKHVEANGNAFEKSVAQTIKKGLRKYNDKAFKVGYVSYKQSYIIGQALAETHYKGTW